MNLFDKTKYVMASMLLATTIGVTHTTIAATEDTNTAADEQVIYKVSAFVRKRSLTGMEISPNGKLLAFTMPHKDQILLTTAEFKDGQFHSANQIPFGQDAYPINLRWASDERLIFTLRQKAKVRRSNYYTWAEVLMSVKADGTDMVWLRTDGKGKGLNHIDNADVVSLLRDQPDHILVGKSRRRNWVQEYYDGAIDDVHKLNIKTGELSLYLKGPKINRFKFNDWYADHKGHIRFGYGSDRKGNSVMIIRGRGDEDWKVLSDNELFEEGKFSPLQFGTEDNEFYVLSSLATGRMAVYRFDIATGTLGSLVFSHDEFDVTGIIYSHDKGKVVAARYNDGGRKIQYLDKEYGAMRGRIAKALDTGFSISSKSDNDNFMVVVAGDERDAGSFYHYDVKARKIDYMGSRYSSVHPNQLSPMENITYETRDGLTISGILTKPRLHSGGPLPFIVMPHSRPNSRDSVEWDRTAQFFANRGYGVFQPNYRGSSGFGQRFRALGHGEWGRDMQNDLIDGTEWLIDEGHAAEGRICIVGRGYAGYAALMGVAKEGELFSCAIARDAPVDIRKMLGDQKALNTDSEEYLEVAGDLKKKELASISPANFVADINKPVLLYHWEDSYYNVKHTRKFVKALGKAKKHFDYLEIEESKGADLYDATKDQRQFLELVEAWLLHVNPTPLLEKASTTGKIAKMPEMTKSGR
jgi:dipeptidyl aminopeptidase/acylaminoacyl peptidase